MESPTREQNVTTPPSPTPHDDKTSYHSLWEMQLPRTKQYIIPQPSPTTKPHTRVTDRCSCQGQNNPQWPNPAWQPNFIPESLSDVVAKDKTIHSTPTSRTTKPHTRVIQRCGCRGRDSSGGEGGCHANWRGWGLHNVEDLHQRGLVADQCAQACQTCHTHIGVWSGQKCRWLSQQQKSPKNDSAVDKTMVTT